MQEARTIHNQQRITAKAALAFLPWLVLKEQIQVGGFRFGPFHPETSNGLYNAEYGQLMDRVLTSYVDLKGNSIRSCTAITYPRRGWNVNPAHFNEILTASQLLALSTLSAQRFFEPLTPYINAAAFRPILQRIDYRTDQISLLTPRRGLSLRRGGPGLTFQSVRFQCPDSLYLAESPSPERQFARALDRARTTKAAVFDRLEAALPLWLLANSDEPSLPIRTQLTLAAAAFEQLLGPFSQAGAFPLAKELGTVLRQFGTITVRHSRRRPDPNPKWRDQQAAWWLHQKWIKELYEFRSEQMHGGDSRVGRSRNWTAEQHQVAAAFVFPLVAKMPLQREGLYTLCLSEVGSCRALDKLLNANDWATDWSEILSTEEAVAELAHSIREGLAKFDGQL